MRHHSAYFSISSSVGGGIRAIAARSASARSASARNPVARIAKCVISTEAICSIVARLFTANIASFLLASTTLAAEPTLPGPTTTISPMTQIISANPATGSVQFVLGVWCPTPMSVTLPSTSPDMLGGVEVAESSAEGSLCPSEVDVHRFGGRCFSSVLVEH